MNRIRPVVVKIPEASAIKKGLTPFEKKKNTYRRNVRIKEMYRGVFLVAVTGVASAAAFLGPPMSLPGMPGSGAALRATASRATARSASLSLEMARVPFIAGNWKMNPTSVEEVPLVSSLSSACTVWQDSLPFLRSKACFVRLFWIGDRHETPFFVTLS